MERDQVIKLLRRILASTEEFEGMLNEEADHRRGTRGGFAELDQIRNNTLTLAARYGVLVQVDRPPE